MDLRAFLDNRLVQDGVIRNFMVMGEATKRISSEVRSAYPDVEWKKIAGCGTSSCMITWASTSTRFG
ncbi:MAG: DUF86 domain-containing protein [Flavobacteriales bacterium]|nr:DUF86 domain-containing protein [Flavobacteriales bacterium]MCC6939749.1 DUF86 domain-containing protein [Flavobacteriales bacterium]